MFLTAKVRTLRAKCDSIAVSPEYYGDSSAKKDRGSLGTTSSLLDTENIPC